MPAIPLTEQFGTVLEAAGVKSKDIAGDFKKAADAAAELERQGEALADGRAHGRRYGVDFYGRSWGDAGAAERWRGADSRA